MVDTVTRWIPQSVGVHFARNVRFIYNLRQTRPSEEFPVTTAPEQHDSRYRDLSATEFKNTLGRVLERVLRGERVRITKHGCVSERVVMIRESDLAALEARAVSPLDALRAEFERLVEDMQSPNARKAAASVGTARMEELSEAAVKERSVRG